MTPKKRGRKPKNKLDEPKVLKKRGRKKKCDLHLDSYKKISGFMEDSIDTKDNKIILTDKIDEELPCESISFGGFEIRRHTAKKAETKSLHAILHQKNSCLIDLDEVEDNIEDKNLENNEENIIEKKNLYDYFDNIQKPEETIIKKKSTVPSKRCEEKSFKKVEILKCYRGKKTLWPEQTDIWCWWCCHPFEGTPRFLPTKYDQRRDRFKVTGNFCSWSCAKRFIIEDTQKFLLPKTIQMFSLLVRKINGYFYNIKAAPPRQMLKVFGGPLTIEEFRNIDDNVYYDIQKSILELDTNYLIRGR